MRQRASAACAIRWVALSSVIAIGAGCHRSAVSQCGAEIPEQRLWASTTDAEMDTAIVAARECAHRRGTRVLLEFVAPWCADCREMTRLDQTDAVSRVLHERYERVRINVGSWDRAAALRQRYAIDRIAAYVVLDADGQRVAQTVLEPITGGHGPVTAPQWTAWLEAPH